MSLNVNTDRCSKLSRIPYSASGGLRLQPHRAPHFTDATSNSRRSSPASSIASGTGQLTPATLARRRYSPTVDGDVPTLWAIARMLNAAAKYSRSTSRIFRRDNLLFASSVPPAKAARIPRRRGGPAFSAPTEGDRFRPESVIGLRRNPHADTASSGRRLCRSGARGDAPHYEHKALIIKVLSEMTGGESGMRRRAPSAPDRPTCSPVAAGQDVRDARQGTVAGARSCSRRRR